MKVYTVYHNYSGKKLGTVYASSRHDAILVYADITGASLASLVAA